MIGQCNYWQFTKKNYFQPKPKDMKRIYYYILLLPVFALSGCSTIKQIATSLIPSELEMVLGLKDALSQGLFKSFEAFEDPSGNPLVRIIFPGDAAKIESTLRDIGFSNAINDVTGKFTNAVSAAVRVAKPMFLDAVQRMSIKDAAKILVTDNLHAASDYFKAAMQPDLMAAFRPIVDSTIHIQGADKEWTVISNAYNIIPFTKNKLETSLTDFVSARAIDGMFAIVGTEEAHIRNKYDLRKTDMMKKAFGYAEEELKRRAGIH